MGKTEGRRRRGWQRMRWLDGHEFEQALEDSEGKGSLVCCSPWGRKESDMTEQLSWLREACRAAVHGVTRTWTWLSDWTITIFWKSVCLEYGTFTSLKTITLHTALSGVALASWESDPPPPVSSDLVWCKRQGWSGHLRATSLFLCLVSD